MTEVECLAMTKKHSMYLFDKQDLRNLVCDDELFPLFKLLKRERDVVFLHVYRRFTFKRIGAMQKTSRQRAHQLYGRSLYKMRMQMLEVLRATKSKTVEDQWLLKKAVQSINKNVQNSVANSKNLIKNFETFNKNAQFFNKNVQFFNENDETIIKTVDILIKNSVSFINNHRKLIRNSKIVIRNLEIVPLFSILVIRFPKNW